MIFVFFVYGLAFFIAGLAIFIYPKKDSAFKLAKRMWLLAGFGVIHGINEWVDMFILIEKPIEIPLLNFFTLPILVVSFLCLAQFGAMAICDVKERFSALKLLPAFLFVGWAVVTMLELSSQRLLLGDIWARYLLGFPGAFLAAYALFLQIPQFKKENLSTITKNLKLSAFVFLFYGLFSGLIVPKAGFFPASIFNYETFLNTVGFPVQILRSICAAIIAYALIRVLSVFDWETKRKTREHRDELITINNQLEKEIAKRKNLEKIKEALTHMIVHDLNNPLMVLSGNLELLEMDLKDIISDEQKGQLQLSLNKSRELKNMISNLLDIGKMEEGKLKLSYEEINLNSLIREITDSMNILAQKEGKNIISKLSSDIPELIADRDILQRIIFNLVGNALKFSFSKSNIEVEARYNDENKDIVVSVKDCGQGIPKDYQDKIFEKFAQVEERQIKGTGKGLGLTFCKMAVEAHGGKIWVESEVGKGSTFYFTLPTKKLIK